jgi:predicted RNase H-related nuclease YkuK (DUF458 family)
MDIKDGMFTSPTLGSLTPKEAALEISKFIDEDPDRYYRVVIGSDSQTKIVDGKNVTDFVTALVVHRSGRGARYFWRKQRVEKRPVLREKIFMETLMSLFTAQEVVPMLRHLIPSSKYDLEVHVDVGPIGPTREMIKEVVGMVNGNGFEAKTKPDSWGASHVADKHT